MRLVVENVFLEVAHQGSSFRELGFMQHPVIQIDFLLVVELSDAAEKDAARSDDEAAKVLDLALEQGHAARSDDEAANVPSARAGPSPSLPVCPMSARLDLS